MVDMTANIELALRNLKMFQSATVAGKEMLADALRNNETPAYCKLLQASLKRTEDLVEEFARDIVELRKIASGAATVESATFSRDARVMYFGFMPQWGIQGT